MSDPHLTPPPAPTDTGASDVTGIKKRKAGDMLRRSTKEEDQAHFFREQEKQHSMHLNVRAGNKIVIPQKRWFRQRAHANPFSDHQLQYPPQPDQMDWGPHYPSYVARPADQKHPAQLDRPVEFADIGCGYGGLLIALAPLFPDSLMIGMEIRQQVADYVWYKARALRLAAARSHSGREEAQVDTAMQALGQAEAADTAETQGREEEEDHAKDEEQNARAGKKARKAAQRARAKAAKEQAKQAAAAEDEDEADEANEREAMEALVARAGDVPGGYRNISAIRANCMKFMPNFFAPGQLTKMFFLFPDPHFKQRKHKARIISSTLLAEYAYVLRPGEGILYTITDVLDLHKWMKGHLDAFPLFERIPDDDLKDDPCVMAIYDATEEGQKVARNKGQKHFAAYRRVAVPSLEDELAAYEA